MAEQALALRREMDMKPTTVAVLTLLLALAACNNEEQDRTMDNTTEPDPKVRTDKTPDTGTGGPVPETPTDDDQQKMRSPSD
ncbi:hypothetical protein [Mesorhizobium sp. RMAD-H1]|uniref:hypothetical protein n=1 Tax=Mesorhizobium sp. RMAD-H1 TaxID=2587065 RepID=UPI0016125A97|nr:hypothetical protein [Mesorhizobium sp. RMAD-H1]MBB2972382.1 hypothetical protein [Mesorhizobium sp. RMAD-H1]